MMTPPSYQLRFSFFIYLFSASHFLADINCEQLLRCLTYRQHVVSLDNLVLIMWADDTTIIQA
jgi:Palmitoyl protein thioesterase